MNFGVNFGNVKKCKKNREKIYMKLYRKHR